jgi:hypothetical protein
LEIHFSHPPWGAISANATGNMMVCNIGGKNETNDEGGVKGFRDLSQKDDENDNDGETNNKKEDSSGSGPYKNQEGNNDDNNGNGKDRGGEEDGNENDGRNQKIARPSFEIIVIKEPMQPTFLKIFQKLPKQIQSSLALKTKKNNKRKLVSYQNNESDDYIINCVKTYH